MEMSLESVQKQSYFDDNPSSGLLPRVSISNIKSPSKRHQTSNKVFTATEYNHAAFQGNILDWLHEIKQLVSFFNIHFYYQRKISDSENLLKLRYTRLHQNLITLEPIRRTTEARSAGARQSTQPGTKISTDSTSRLLPYIQELFELLRETVARNDLPSNIQKGTLRTISKLLEYKKSLVELLKLIAQAKQTSDNPAGDASKNAFQPSLFLKTLFECQFDTHDTYQEEIILLTIQKIVIQLTKHFSDTMTEDELFKNCVYFFRVLKKRAINDRQITSLHMQEGTKQNMNKLFTIIMKMDGNNNVSAPDQSTSLAQKYKGLKRQVFKMFARKILKNVDKMSDALTAQALPEEVSIKREYISFIIKAFTESFQALVRKPNCQNEVSDFINEEKEIIIQVLCKAGEFQDIAVRSMAQLLFQQVLQQVLELKVPFREEIEVLFSKLLLKPMEQLDKKLMKGLDAPQLNQNAAKKDQIQQISSGQASIGEVSFLSDDEETADSVDKGAASNTAATSYDQSDQFELEASLNMLIDTLLALQPDQFAQIFLVYDCQPLSANLIRRSLHLIIRHTQLQGRQTDLSKTFQVLGMIMQGLLRYELPKTGLAIGQTSKGMTGIIEMLQMKKKARKIAAQANVKPKAFFAAIEEGYEGISQPQLHQLASKVLLNSRIVSLDKIAEIIGGKDDRAKFLLEQYLERQDYAECDIEKSLRSFMQTFRLAGVDSQVVFNILEKFGDKYYEKDHTNLFTSGAEAYNFTYLIIVLQTCQHNAAIKEKTQLDRFFSQAKEMVPESYERLPEGMVEEVFNRITQKEIKAPVTRDLYASEYERACGFQEIEQRTVMASNYISNGEPLSENEFLTTSDLRERQLFDMHNRILGVAPESLQLSALRQIVNMLTAKFVQIRQKVGDSRFNTVRLLELTKQLIQTNSHFMNNSWVDRLMIDLDRQVEIFCRIPKLEAERKTRLKSEIQALFWSNFKSLDLATGLVPKMAPSMSRSIIHYPSFNAVEVKIRNKFNKEIPASGLTTQRFVPVKPSGLEGEESKTPQASLTTSKLGIQVISPDTGNGQSTDQAPMTTPRQNSGLFSVVYNYFTPVPSEAEEEAKRREYIMSGQNQIDLLMQQLNEFNKQTAIDSQDNENVDESYFFDFLIDKGIDSGDALRQIASFINQNMSSRRASLCLSYLFRVYIDSKAYQDSERGLSVQQTILSLCQNLVYQITNRTGCTSNISSSSSQNQHQQHKQAGFSQIALSSEDILSDSLDDSVSQKSDSTTELSSMSMRGIDSHQNLAKMLLREPKKNQFEVETTTQVNKHLVLELYFSVVSKFLVQNMTTGLEEAHDLIEKGRPSANNLIKDVQKTLLALNEDELTREDFEPAFLYEKITEFIKPTKLTSDDLNKTGDLLEDDDSVVQKLGEPDEEGSGRIALMHGVSSEESEPMLLPLREYPKIRKFLHLLFILMAQQSTGTKTVCNDDHMQVALTKLIRAISEMFLLQETVPYDQINRSLDVLVKNSDPFKTFHPLAGDYLEDLVAICSTFFQLLERGSDGKTQKLFQQGQFDLWFKTMSLMVQKILLSPYIALFKSMQERSCTLMKIQILTFQFQPLTTNGDSPAANQARANTKLIFEELVFILNIATLQNQRDWLQQKSQESQLCRQWVLTLMQSWEDSHEGFARLCQLCASTLTDVFIQYAQQIKQESDQHPESYEVFSILWNKFMLVLLNYADSAESLLIEETELFASVQPLQQSIQDNIQRVMEFLLYQDLLLDSSTELDNPIAQAKVKLYKKTKAALGLFWQEVHIRTTPSPGIEP